ncbi:hypothetical protein CC85DRAFT_282396 [Cutaneotrichosporon oleaginosum]|uniref:DUF1275 domain protein n=1 Tax=Cutaneotrichosporon oleaginosum TaxID=879819 RepID=A0A0J0XXH1_9TREE|nr:uncharacterized protein CC85DRAFT_282396 [Cutaneotrichosporon oleaginosum]KLT45765.1 hypothetical protein CC85DRAFT_282396 [Cutaneotrichosporon oleaginosum]TXT04471.1 hypothetical protein COLE_07290 [Cutaneotrichosporon oleaginosum]
MSYGATGPPASLASASPTPPDTREIAPLLPSDKDRWTRHRLGGRAMVVSNLILTLATSMLDVVCYAKYSTFSSNQTGNTVMLATASLHLRTSPRKCILATTSLVAWLTGAFLFGQARRSRRNSRGWLFVTSGAQMAVLLLYVWLISPYAPSVFDLDGRYEWVSMATCAFQSGIQFVMATGVGVREINAATVTASYASLVADPLLFSTTPQQGRDRRVVYLVTFWLGCILGLFFEQHLGAWAAALIVAGVKLLSFAIIYHAEEAE